MEHEATVINNPEERSNLFANEIARDLFWLRGIENIVSLIDDNF